MEKPRQLKLWGAVDKAEMPPAPPLGPVKPTPGVCMNPLRLLDRHCEDCGWKPDCTCKKK